MESSDTLLKPGQSIRPPGDEKMAKNLLKTLYGMTVTKIQRLNAYDDRNYHVLCEESHTNPHLPTVTKDGYVLKIINSLDSQNSPVIEAQTEILLFLNQRNITCPVPVKNLNGTYYSLEKLNNEDPSKTYAVRLFIYYPGELLHRVPLTDDLFRNIGTFVAKLDKTLKDFNHQAFNDRKTSWMLTSVPKLRQFTYAVKDVLDRELAHEVILCFEKNVLQVMPQLEQSTIHGDINEHNIVMGPNGTEIAAIIDFGDCHRSCVIFDLAITLCYMILQSGNLSMGKYIVQGYQDVRQLTELEKSVLKVTVCARICQSLVMGAYSHLYDPQNDYLLATQKSGWILLKKLWPLSQDNVLQQWGLMD